MPREPRYDKPSTDQTVPLHHPPSRSQRASANDPRQVQPPRYVEPPLQRSQRRKSSAHRWLRRLLLTFILGLLLACVGTVAFQQYIAHQVALADVRQSRPPSNLLLAPSNILLLGVDLREGYPEEGIRSDTIILLHLDPAAGWGSLLSIPRDSIATIPGVGEDKINAAFAQGYERAERLSDVQIEPTAAGAALAADTVEQFLGLRDFNTRIDYVATINFNGFAKIIDAVGGIDIDVPFEIIDNEYPTDDFGITTVHFPSGPQHMDGARALQYVRTRHADNDFGRAQRQQQVIQAITQALRDKPLLLRPFVALRLIDAAGDAIRTTMPIGRPDALLMAMMLTRIEPAHIVQLQISPETVVSQEVGSDIHWDRSGVQALVSEALTPPGKLQEQVTIQVLNGAGIEGIAGRMTAVLQQQGFTTVLPDNAPATQQTYIIAYGDHAATRIQLQELFNGAPIIERSSTEAPSEVNFVIVLGTDYRQYWSDL
jgi:LCP family protein required for cell wall assembly